MELLRSLANRRKLEFVLRKPFDVILDHAKSEKWLPTPKDNISELNISKILDLLEDSGCIQNIKAEIDIII